MANGNRERADALKQTYALAQHPEGGWFAEVYTSPRSAEGRPLAGSIYFLLDGAEVSHLHTIDCDEIWYFHEGCGLRITVLVEGRRSELLLGMGEGQTAMAVIPAGAVFAAENLDGEGYTFLSCATAPAFSYAGFRLIGQTELGTIAPSEADALSRLAMPEETL